MQAFSGNYDGLAGPAGHACFVPLLNFPEREKNHG
jgi:hypothetical protein